MHVGGLKHTNTKISNYCFTWPSPRLSSLKYRACMGLTNFQNQRILKQYDIMLNILFLVLLYIQYLFLDALIMYRLERKKIILYLAPQITKRSIVLAK
jgi:hypothetical protein